MEGYIEHLATDFLPFFMGLVFIFMIFTIVTIMRRTLPMDPFNEPVEESQIAPDARRIFDWYDHCARTVGLTPVVTFTTRKFSNPNFGRVYLSADHLVMAEAIWVRVSIRTSYQAVLTTQLGNGTLIYTKSDGPSMPTVVPPWISKRVAPARTDLATLFRLHLDHLREQTPPGVQPAPIPETDAVPIIARRTQKIFEHQITHGLLRRDDHNMVWRLTPKMVLKIVFNFILLRG